MIVTRPVKWNNEMEGLFKVSEEKNGKGQERQQV
jgi:hypothetical protein